MAASVTFTEYSRAHRVGEVQLIKCVWVSSTTGAASGSGTKAYSGRVVEVVTVPSTAAAPSANYDITLAGPEGIDLLLGQGANRHTSNTEYVLSSTYTSDTGLGYLAFGKLTITVSSAGDSKGGTVYVYIK